jgi:hypothetical protein
MKNGRIALAVGIFVSALGLSTSAFADFCVNTDNGVSYRLQIGNGTPVAGTPIIIAGSRTVSTITTPVFGTLISTPTATLVGLTEIFKFGSGQFLDPAASTMFIFPKPNPGNPRYDTTFHGAGTPHNVQGGLAVVTCPASGPAATGTAKDPNGVD